MICSDLIPINVVQPPELPGGGCVIRSIILQPHIVAVLHYTPSPPLTNAMRTPGLGHWSPRGVCCQANVETRVSRTRVLTSILQTSSIPRHQTSPGPLASTAWSRLEVGPLTLN